MNRKEHWESIYASKNNDGLSWTQPEPRLSLSLIKEVCPRGRIVDIGGGTSSLAAGLLDAGYTVAVLDVSEAALTRAQARLGSRAGEVRWIVADVTASPDLGTFEVWHDRAAFHFLTSPVDRAAYIALMARTIVSGGHVVMAAFAPDGPEKCSGLEVCRYDGPSLAATLGKEFSLLKSEPELHLTPRGTPQSFQYSLFLRA